MNKLHNTTGDKTPLLSCLIRTKYPELEAFIRASLEGISEFSPDEPDIIIEDSAHGISLSAADGNTVFTERPFSPDLLADTVLKLCDRVSDLQFSADAENRLAILGDTSVSLTDTEFRLYSAILKKGGRLISAAELSMEVWGRDDRNLCTVYLSYLRRKLNTAFGDGTLITVSKKGYRLRTPDN